MSGSIFAQGNFGINVGLNDDNFGSIKNIKTKIDDYDLDLKNSTGFHLGVFLQLRPTIQWVIITGNRGESEVLNLDWFASPETSPLTFIK